MFGQERDSRMYLQRTSSASISKFSIKMLTNMQSIRRYVQTYMEALAAAEAEAELSRALLLPVAS